MCGKEMSRAHLKSNHDEARERKHTEERHADVHGKVSTLYFDNLPGKIQTEQTVESQDIQEDGEWNSTRKKYTQFGTWW